MLFSSSSFYFSKNYLISVQRSKILSAEQQHLADNWTYQFILIF